MKKVFAVLVVSAVLLAAPALAFDRLGESFEYADWPEMNASGWDWITTKTDPNVSVQFVTDIKTDGAKAIRFAGTNQTLVFKTLEANYSTAVVKGSWYYEPSQGYDCYYSVVTLKNLDPILGMLPGPNGMIVRAGGVDATTGRRILQTRYLPSTAFANRAVFELGWNDLKIVYEGTTVTTYLNGRVVDQNTAFDPGGGLGAIQIGRDWANNTANHSVAFDNFRVGDAGLFITPHIKQITTGATQEFNFGTLSENLPMTWEVVDGVGEVVASTDPAKPSVGVFSAGMTPGISKIRATDAAGRTDYIVLDVISPKIDPSPGSVVLGTTAPFVYANAIGDVTWTVQNESGGPGSVGNIDFATGVFTPVAVGTCEVTATDSAGNYDVATVTVIAAAARQYASDNSTLALYHLDEGAGQTWYDASGRGLDGTTLDPTLPLYHVPGQFGNAATGFRAAGSAYTAIQVPATTALNGDELTAEAWVYYPEGTDPLANDPNAHAIMCRRGSTATGSTYNTWGLCFGKYGVGAAGSLTFLWWNTNSAYQSLFPEDPLNPGTPRNLNLKTNTWYHVAVTFKKIDTAPTYEVKLYCTEAGSTTPVEVASKTTTYPLRPNNDFLRIGGETNNVRSFPGLIDEVRISNRARTPEELSWILGSGSQMVAEPVITPGSGSYRAAQNVTIECPDQNATIYYTTNGIDPDLNSPVYDGTPIRVSPERDTTIKAMAYRPGFISSYATAVFDFPNYARPMHIPYTYGITIDGDLSEWSTAEWAPLDQSYDGNPFDIAEAYYAAKWGEDGNKVYVAVKVRDAAPWFTEGYTAWYARDATEIYIHTTGTGPVDYSATQADAQQYVTGFNPLDPLGMFEPTVWKCVSAGLTAPEGAFESAAKISFDAPPEAWIYYETAITPYHYFSLDGIGLQVSTLSAGQVIGLDAVAVSNDGSGTSYFEGIPGYTGMKAENMQRDKWRNYAQFGAHILQGPAEGLAAAKAAADGTAVSVPAIVSAVFTDCFYVGSSDRTYGIRVNQENHGRSVGEAVVVKGSMGTLDSAERYIAAASVVVTGSGDIDPLGMTNKALGGRDYGTLPLGQAGVAGGIGVNNIGLLVTVTGRVTTKDVNWFMIDDGSGVGVKVYGAVPAGTPYISVKGISSCEKDTGGAIQRVILATGIVENAQ